MKPHILFTGLLLAATSFTVRAQLVIQGGTLTIEANATIQVQGGIQSSANISGAGKVVLIGDAPQAIDMNGFTIPNLEVNSTVPAFLASNCVVGNSLLFSQGRIQLNDYHLSLTANANVTGTGAGKFIETNGLGELRRLVNGNGTFTLPVGVNGELMPLSVTVSGATTGAGAYVGTRLVGNAHPNRHIRISDYLNAYWLPATNAITGGTITATATYNEAATGLTGTEAALTPVVRTGTSWALNSGTINTTNNTVSFNNVAAGQQLYAMNKFVLASGRAFLQGAYNATTGKMNDNLRTPSNLIPLADPYRVAPYNTAFVHNNNSDAETAASAVFSTQTNDDNNIVDWVFLELRNSSNQLQQTRSALLQKDGDIVDIDGVSPVLFKNIDAGSYILTVRHRNHLGMGADATTYTKTLNLNTPDPDNVFNFAQASDAQLFGTAAAYTTGTHPTLTTVNLMWAGNANSNGNVRYSGLQNDKDFILVTTLNNTPTQLLSNVYHQADVNMNRNVRYAGLQNDKDFLLITVLSNIATTIRTQAIPN